MSNPVTHTQINLQIQTSGDPIAGMFADHAGTGRPFLGWMELVSPIEDARTAPSADPMSGECAEGFRGGV